MAGEEAKVERKVCKDALNMYGVESIKQKRVGWPDQLFLLGKGEILYIEFKKVGEEPTDYQDHILRQLNHYGYRAEWTDNYDEAMTYIRNALAEVHHTMKVKK